MPNILLKRGTNRNLNSLTLQTGEPAFVTDTGKLYIGNGNNKILINSIDKPPFLDTISHYTKVKVNDYGQVVGQSTLTITDIPQLPTTKITGIGTAATVNTGTTVGTIPVLDSKGKLSTTVLPIEKPTPLDTVNLFPKVKVNDYGQVIGQFSLATADIPSLPYTKITGLGTSATVNTGNTVGTIPILDSSGKLPSSVIPSPTSAGAYAMANYVGADGVQVTPGNYVPLTSFSTSNSNQFSIDSNGIVTINLIGTYLVSYSISSGSSAISIALGNGTTFSYPGSMARSSATAVPAYVSVGATIVRNITTIPEKYGIKNYGSFNFPMLAVHGVLTIVKIG